jgi:CxxC motif-containing protein (DUF1111 family)
MIRSLKIGFVLSFSSLILSCTGDATEDYIPLQAEDGEAYSGGLTTVFDTSVNAFGFQAANLTGDDALFFFTGNSLFTKPWVFAGASTTARDGLGPFFNARACSACHFKDGRGRPPSFAGELDHGLLLRLGIPNNNAEDSAFEDPIYRGQLQDQAMPGVQPEGSFTIEYTNVDVIYPDGSRVTLRKPNYSINSLSYGELDSGIKISPRVANHMVGLGLLEAITDQTLIEFADEFDSDNDGISGRSNYVWDIQSESFKIGRFGWKANQPNVRQQIASAFSGDLGITSTLFPDENCPEGVDCDQILNGGAPEIDNEDLRKVTLYSSTLAVPARRNYEDQDILEGKKLFNDFKCTSCHKAKIETGNHPIEALSFQTIRPYTDLLLHDMGPGLADELNDFLASGSEWRTPPLWGIGLFQTVNDHTFLLHDGRARTIEEAILWHGGEGDNSKNEFMNASEQDRQKLINFIESL